MRPAVAMPKRFLTFVFMGWAWVATFRTTRSLFLASNFALLGNFALIKGPKSRFEVASNLRPVATMPKRFLTYVLMGWT